MIRRPSTSRSRSQTPNSRVSKRTYRFPTSELAIFNDSKIGIVEADLRRKITYANRAAMHMLGVSDCEGLYLSQFMADDTSRGVLDAALTERGKGLIGNYRVTVKRSDGSTMPVDVTGVPRVDGKGQIVGSVGFFRTLERQQLINDVHIVNRSGKSANDLLVSVCERMKKVIPFEVMTVTRYSRDLRHANVFWVHGLGGSRSSRRRWMQLNQEQVAWIADSVIRNIPDLIQLMEDPLWAPMKDDPFVKEIMAANCRSVLLRGGVQPDGLIGVIALLRKEASFFTKEHEEILSVLPLDATLMHAIDYTEKRQVVQRMELVKALNRCTSIQTAGKVLAQRFVDMFGWSHVSFWMVDRPEAKIRLVAQHWAESDEMQVPDPHEQDIDKGILGRTVREMEVVIINDVRLDPTYIPLVVGKDEIASEMCCPISLEGDKAVRWIVNVEDVRPNSFSSDERDEMKAIAAEEP